MIKKNLFIFILMGLLLFIFSCSQSPTDSFLADFQETYGDLDSIEDLILQENFDSSYTSRWTLGSHYYDFRSGYARSGSMTYNSLEHSLRMNHECTSSGYDSSKELYCEVNGMKLSSALRSFKPSNDKSLFIQFHSSLAEGTTGNYNKIILTLNTGIPSTYFNEESDEEEKCQKEPMGRGLAFIIESDKTEGKRYLRIEKLTGELPLMGTYDYDSLTCTSNDSELASTFYDHIYEDTIDPYTDAGYYPRVTRRFMNLNPTPIMPETPDEYEYPSSISGGSNEIMFEQKEISNTDLDKTTLESKQEHIIEVREDNTVIWTAFGKTYTFTNFKDSSGLDLGDGFTNVSFKFDEFYNSPDQGATALYDLLITLK